MTRRRAAPYRIIVCGGRTYANSARVNLTLERFVDLNPTIVHGAARGADTLAGREAAELGFRCEAHPAQWERHGRAAGPVRNQEMIDGGADVVIAFGGGAGTNDCLRRARKAGIPTIEIDR